MGTNCNQETINQENIMTEIITKTLTGKVKWARVASPQLNQMSGKLEYQVNLVLDKDLEKELEALRAEHKIAQNIKTDSEEEKVFVFKRGAVSKATQKEIPGPQVVTADLQPLEEGTLIGNGSICTVNFSIIPYSNKFGTGATTRLNGLQVIDLVKYEKVNNMFEAKDGYTNEPKAKKDAF